MHCCIIIYTITTFVPAAKTGKFLDYTSKYFSLKGSYDAIIVGAAYAKAALDYNSYGLGKKGISKSDFGKAVRQYLWVHEKNDIFKSVYGNQDF